MSRPLPAGATPAPTGMKCGKYVTSSGYFAAHCQNPAVLMEPDHYGDGRLVGRCRVHSALCQQEKRAARADVLADLKAATKTLYHAEQEDQRRREDLDRALMAGEVDAQAEALLGMLKRVKVGQVHVDKARADRERVVAALKAKGVKLTRSDLW